MDKEKISIIGGGISGLAVASFLASKGYLVSLYEQSNNFGGKLSQVTQDGFRWDSGPSLFTLPEVLEKHFNSCGANLSDYLTYKKLSSITEYFWKDKTHITAYQDRKLFAKEIATKTEVSEKEVLDYLDKAKKKYDLVGSLFLEKSLQDPKTFLNLKALKGIILSYQLEPFKTLHKVNAYQFRKSEKIIQLFDRYATYNGSNPYFASATLSMISHLEHNLGAYYPNGGMISIQNALVKLCADKGVQMNLNSPVDRILLSANQVEGILVNGKEISTDKVVSAIDIQLTYNKLLQGIQAPDRMQSTEPSTSAMVFFWGVKGKPIQNLGLHNILFSDNYLKEFHSLSKLGAVYNEPTVYIYISSKENPSDAPEDSENWFVMINTPYIRDNMDREQFISECRAHVVKKINNQFGIQIEQFITSELSQSPWDIEYQTGSYKGSLYGASSNTIFSAFLRHSNISSKINGLFFCGGSVHPGGGIPLCLNSGRIVGELIANQV